MKTNKVAIILGLFLLPVLLNAQEKSNKVISQITDNGVTFTITDINLDSIEIVNIQNQIQQEVNRVQKDKEQQQLRKGRVEENRGKIAAIFPTIAKEPLKKILAHLSQKRENSDYFEYSDAKYYEKAELHIDKTYKDKPKVLTFDNAMFFFYERSQYDEGWSWDEWMILVFDTNTGDLKYKHDFSGRDKTITLTNLLNPEEKSVYKDNFH